MAHFAKVNSDNLVEQVIVISNSDLVDETGQENETLGVAICEQIVGPGLWVQTSYNGNFNGEFARPGYVYTPEHRTFRSPHPPFPSWSVGPNGTWVAPVDKPISDFLINWSELNQNWVVNYKVRIVGRERINWNDITQQWESWDYETETFVRSSVQYPAPEESNE